MPSVASAVAPRSTAPPNPVRVAGIPRAGQRRVSATPAGDDGLNSIADCAEQFTDLYHAHHGRVLRLCRALLSDPDEAADVAQEIFAKLFRQWERSGNTIAWAPWLTRVTVNACRDRRRSGWWKWWREGHQEFSETEFSSPTFTPEQEALGRETRVEIWRCFRQLSPRQQEVFALRYLDEWSTEEVAGLLGLSSGSVKRHLYRAVQQMRHVLGGRR